MTIRPNFSVESSWKTTISKAFQQLRRLVFLEPADFKFLPMPTEVSASGSMTFTIGGNLSSYCVIEEVAWVRLYLYGTTAGVASTTLYFTVPFTSYFSTLEPDGQYTPCYLEDGAGFEVGTLIMPRGANRFAAQKVGAANFGLGASRYIICNFFCRIQT